MNIHEFGNIFLRVNAEEDISANTNTLELISPAPYRSVNLITVADGLTVGSVPIDIGGGVIYNANEYVEYLFQDGDIFMSGEWEVRLISEGPGDIFRKLNNNKLTFTVDP